MSSRIAHLRSMFEHPIETPEGKKSLSNLRKTRSTESLLDSDSNNNDNNDQRWWRNDVSQSNRVIRPLTVYGISLPSDPTSSSFPLHSTPKALTIPSYSKNMTNETEDENNIYDEGGLAAKASTNSRFRTGDVGVKNVPAKIITTNGWTTSAVKPTFTGLAPISKSGLKANTTGQNSAFLVPRPKLSAIKDAGILRKSPSSPIFTSADEIRTKERSGIKKRISFFESHDLSLPPESAENVSPMARFPREVGSSPALKAPSKDATGVVFRQKPHPSTARPASALPTLRFGPNSSAPARPMTTNFGEAVASNPSVAESLSSSSSLSEISVSPKKNVRFRSGDEHIPLTGDISTHRRDSFLHGSKGRSRTRAEIVEIAATASDNSTNYVELDPRLVEQFERRFASASEDNVEKNYYSAVGDEAGDVEKESDELGSSYDRLLLFTRKQFIESKKAAAAVSTYSEPSIPSLPTVALQHSSTLPSAVSVSVSASEQIKRSFSPLPVPPHKPSTPSTYFRVDADEDEDNIIKPYAVVYPSHLDGTDHGARQSSVVTPRPLINVHPSPGSLFNMLPGVKNSRSTSEPSLNDNDGPDVDRMRSNSDLQPIEENRLHLAKTFSSPAFSPKSESNFTTSQRRGSQGSLLGDEPGLTKEQLQLRRTRQLFFKVTENVKPLDSEQGFSPKPPPLLHELKDDQGGRQSVDEEETYRQTYEKKLRYVNSRRYMRERTIETRRSSSSRKTRKQQQLMKQKQGLFNFVLLVKLEVRGTIRRDLKDPRESQTLKPYVAEQFPDCATADVATIAQFCFPETSGHHPIWEADCETFLFVLTGADSSRQYGYCRRFLPLEKGPTKPVVYCIVSSLFSFALYDKILSELESYVDSSPDDAWEFLKNAYDATLPLQVGKPSTIISPLPAKFEDLQVCKPSDRSMENVDLSILLRMLGPDNVIQLFSTTLLERSVILVSRQLTELSRCTLALVAILYPFNWEHTLIPILPDHLLEICCAPSPYIIGVQESSLEALSQLELEDVLIVNLDEGRIVREMGDEATILPPKLRRSLLRGLQLCRDEIAENVAGTTVPSGLSNSDLLMETFVCFFVSTIGHYLEYINYADGEEGGGAANVKRRFNKTDFCDATISDSLRMFLVWFSETHMFELFINGRLEASSVKSGDFEKKIFEYQEEFASYSKQTAAQLRMKVKNFGQMFKQIWR